MTPELIAQIALALGGVTALITAGRPVLKALGGFVEDAQELWHGLKANNQDTAVIKGLLDRMNKMQIDQDELDRLRRWKKAYDSHPACQGGCRDAIEQMVDDRRIRPLNQPSKPTGNPTPS